jgi:uncharacterized protein YceK
MSKRWLFISSIIIVSLSLSACMTLISQTVDPDEKDFQEKFCGGGGPLPYIYSGFIMDVKGLGHYGCDRNGKCEFLHTGTNNFEFFFLIDMPLSLALDTVLLPVTIYRQIKYGNLCKYISSEDTTQLEKRNEQ